MPRAVTRTVIKRLCEVVAEVDGATTVRWLAEKYDLSPQQVRYLPRVAACMGGVLRYSLLSNRYALIWRTEGYNREDPYMSAMAEAYRVLRDYAAKAKGVYLNHMRRLVRELLGRSTRYVLVRMLEPYAVDGYLPAAVLQQPFERVLGDSLRRNEVRLPCPVRLYPRVLPCLP